MEKLDLKRLHKVHFHYPNNHPGEGKTTYCFDQILRLIQLGEGIEQIVYLTTTRKAAEMQRDSFLKFFNQHYSDLGIGTKNCIYFVREKVNVFFLSIDTIEDFKVGRRIDVIIEDIF